MTRQRIFTTGYAGKDVEDLKPMLLRLDAKMVDIRFAPYSQVMHWRKVYLEALLGSLYLHIPNLGNRTYKENKITIQNIELGLETLFGLRENVVLMCACKKRKDCHRKVIAEELKRRGLDAEEITSWKSSETSDRTNLFNT